MVNRTICDSVQYPEAVWRPSASSWHKKTGSVAGSSYSLVSGRRFALNIGVTPATVSRFLAGKTALTPALAIRIAAALGSTPEFWLRLQSAYDLRQLEDQIDTSGIISYGEQEEPLQGTPKH